VGEVRALAELIDDHPGDCIPLGDINCLQVISGVAMVVKNGEVISG
jgi:hypothetical protein